jgi:hypothetical protein
LIGQFIFFSDFLVVPFFFQNVSYHMVVLLTDHNTTAFKEVAIISHPRVGEYAFGFITSTMVLQVLFAHFLLIQKHESEVSFLYSPFLLM